MAVTITASPTIVGSAGTVTITWSGNTGATNADWFGWFTPGQPDSSGGQGGPGTQWWYTSTTATSGSMPMPQTPPTGGPYEVRMFSNGGYTRLGVSNQFNVAATIFLTNTALTTWTVPSDWNNASNTVECIGGGGAGSTAGSGHVGSGGEGGHYAKSANLTVSGTVNIAIGAGGVAPATGDSIAPSGGNTWFGGTNFATSLCGAVGGMGAQGGTNNPATTPTTSDRGDVVRQGGFGPGFGPDNVGGSSGGGAAGPGGVGGAGANDGSSAYGGGGGGAGNTGGDGKAGSNASGSGGGVGGAAGDGTAGGAAATAGSRGSGGGGAQGPSAGAGGLGVDSSWDASHGPGGGGGGGGATVSPYVGGAGGLYGGAGGGAGWQSGVSALGGNGAQGIIVIQYTPAAAPTAKVIPIQAVT